MDDTKANLRRVAAQDRAYIIRNETGVEIALTPFADKNMHAAKVLGKRILLADDQQAVRHAIKYLLELDAHSVIEARNGREAYDLFRRGSFDLVITDYAMPEMAGNELADQIKRLTPNQPVLMITAYIRETIAKNPVDAILNKPFSFQELRDAIARLVTS